MQAIWRWLADAVAGLHLAYLAYLICGGFLAWRWRRTIGGHAVAAAWGAVIVTTSAPCPLTALQNNLREHAGQAPLGASFIDTYVRGRFFPADRLGLVQVVVGLLVLVSWVGYGRGIRHHRPSPVV